MDDTEAAEVRAQDAAVQAIAKASTSSPNKANTVADKAVLFSLNGPPAIHTKYCTNSNFGHPLCWVSFWSS